MPLPNLPNFEPTVWEKKLRAERLEDETLEVRAWREEAEKPDTTGERLELIAEAVADYQQDDGHEGSGLLVMEAIVCHPNAPPLLLRQWMRDCARSFCRNPVAPFVLLEAPDFIASLILSKCHALLREENAPKSLVTAIAEKSNAITGVEETAWEACFHVALAGEVLTTTEGEKEIERYWHWHWRCARIDVPINDDNEKDESARKVLELRRKSIHRRCELTELGIAPAWANAPSLRVEHSWSEPCLEVKHGSYESATDLNATPQVLEQVYQSEPTNQILRFLACHPNTPANLLVQLAQCNDVQARRLARRHKNVPAGIVNLSRQFILHSLSHDYGNTTVFEKFVYGMYGVLGINTLEMCGRNTHAFYRIAAAIGLPTEPVPLSSTGYGRSKPTDCTTRDLLEHLARDGNRLVRWAAQTRLRNPDYVFRWAEPE